MLGQVLTRNSELYRWFPETPENHPPYAPASKTATV